jgi:DNA-binding beta-propeller fold protein YncE
MKRHLTSNNPFSARALRTLCAASACLALSSISYAQNAAPARHLLALSDTDMVGTAYIDGLLGPAINQPDTLSVFDLSRSNSAAVGRINASNSVYSPPRVLAVAAGGKVALVLETLPARAPGMTQLSELEAKPGNQLRAFDVSTPSQPRLLSEVQVNARPQAISVNPGGDLAIVAGLTPAMGLNFVRVSQTGISNVQTVELPVPARPDLGFEAVNMVSWHPSGRYIAVHLTFRSEIAFFEVRNDAQGKITLAPWGNRVQVNKFPLNGAFSPDGRWYFSSDLMWGPDVQAFFRVNQGLITSVRMASPDAPASAVNHQVAAVSPGGLSSESIAVSPDGRSLVALAMRNTGQLKNDPIYDKRASVLHFRIDSSNGTLTLLKETFFEAVLPQGLIFDPTGQFLYVGINEYEGEQTSLKGAVEVWRMTSGDQPSLQRTTQRFRAPRGVHSLALLP